MPQLKEIRKGYDIGIKDGHEYTQTMCPRCKKERWLQKRTENKLIKLCRKCSNQVTGIKKAGRISGNKHASWKGGRKYNNGYVLIWVGKDDFFYPMASSKTSAGGYIPEHRLIVAKSLGRCLLRWETIHHKEGYAKDDNRYPESLELLPNPYKHDALTRMIRHIRKLETKIKELKLKLREEI